MALPGGRRFRGRRWAARGRAAADRELADGGRAAPDGSGAPGVAVVEPHDVEATVRELPAELLGPGDHLRRESHDQDERRIGAVAEPLPAQLDLGADAAELLGHGRTVPGRGSNPDVSALGGGGHTASPPPGAGGRTVSPPPGAGGRTV